MSRTWGFWRRSGKFVWYKTSLTHGRHLSLWKMSLLNATNSSELKGPAALIKWPSDRWCQNNLLHNTTTQNYNSMASLNMCHINRAIPKGGGPWVQLLRAQPMRSAYLPFEGAQICLIAAENLRENMICPGCNFSSVRPCLSNKFLRVLCLKFWNETLIYCNFNQFLSISH